MLAAMKRTNLILAAMAAALTFVGIGSPAGAQSAPRQIGVFQDWRAYTYQVDGKKICYAVSKPKSSRPTNVRRGEIYMMVTNRPGEKVKDEVSVYIGYPFKSESSARIRIGGDATDLFTKGENAWTPNPETDGKLIKQMRRGRSMVINGTSARGTKTTDTYSLMGFTKAHRAIASACS